MSGRAQTDIDQSARKAARCVFRGQRVLFATKKTLIKESAQIRESCSWQFEFRIPTCCTARDGFRLRQWDHFESDAEQQLLPDFASSCTRADGSNAANAVVIYELKASLVAHENKLEAIEPLNMATLRSIERPELVTTAALAGVALRSDRLFQHGLQNSLLGSRRLRYAGSSKPPSFAAFQLKLQGSRQRIIGRPFPLQLSVRYDDTTPTPLNKQKVHLQSLDIKLRAHTSIRCSGSKYLKAGCLSIHKGDQFEDWDEELQLNSCDLTKLEAGSRRSTIAFSKAPGLEIPVDAAAANLDLHQHTIIPS
ncbi:MAG: hypothetical protein Q9188_006054 [Gyalolechia gomerana]